MYRSRLTGIILLSAVLLLPTHLWAGLNTADPGLPIASAYNTIYANNENSAMCVDCHGANPMNARSTTEKGTHFVIHYDGSTVRTANALDPQMGALKTSAWSSTALSKYASPAPPAPTAVSVTGTTGQIICESCHNLRLNVAGGKNLVADYLPADPTVSPSPLCEGCHAGVASGPPKHHPLTGDDVGDDAEDSQTHSLNTSHSSRVFDPPNPVSSVYYPQANAIICDSCHTPHGGQTATAARILRDGASRLSNPLFTGKAVNLIYELNIPEFLDSPGDIKVWDTGNVISGIDRQVDVETASGVGSHLVSNYDPLCQACH